MKTLVTLVALALPAAGFAEDEIAGIGPVGKVTKIQGNFKFTEGPAWDGTNLFFTDIPATTIYRLDPAGKITPVTTDSKHCNGLMTPTSGGLLACQMDGQLVRYTYSLEGGKLAFNKNPKVLAKSHDGARFNAPNDLVIDKSGGIYFTDPRFRAPRPWPQKVEGVYYVPAGGKPKRLLEHRNAPNGVILSPNEKTLYVVHSASKTIMAYNVIAPGKIDKGKAFAEIKQRNAGGNSGGDGLTVDVKGNLYVTTGLGVQVFDPNRKRLGIISFPEVPANCTFGGKDMKTLYVTARTGLYSVKTKIAGHRFAGASKNGGK